MKGVYGAVIGILSTLGITSAQEIPPSKVVDLSSGCQMEFVYVQPGSFFMGSPIHEADRDGDEGPEHRVQITRGFYLGRYEVTQRQWRAIMGSNPSVFQQSFDDEDPLDRPVDSVSWRDAQLFIERLNALRLGVFRLPSEAEWEYAARAETATPYSFQGNPHSFAWFNSRSMASSHPVGKKQPNGWGLYDMHGNVWEWCSDWYSTYCSEESKDPIGPTDGKYKVFRGGSWYDFPNALRSANRHRHAPDQGFSAIGLRLVLESQPGDESYAILPGGLAMRFKSLPAGDFLMGSPDSESAHAQDEGPILRVTISEPFRIGTHEVTQAQWQAVMAANPAVFSKDSNNPVEMVSWNDAQEFLRRLNSLDLGGRFQLPTEAQWEYAARSKSTTRFFFGDDPVYESLPEYAWFYSRAEGRSHPVGLKKPNAWGLFDMYGNVWEWCSDWFGPYDSTGSTNDPTGPATGTGKVIRGGSWFNEPEALRSANRHKHSPDSRQTNIGLRVVWMFP